MTSTLNLLVAVVIVVGDAAAAVCCGTEAEQEILSAMVLKVERTKDERDGQLWYILRIVLRDKNAKVYRVRSECIATNPESPISCGRIRLPRSGLTYKAIYLTNLGIQFGEEKHIFELESEEIADCRQ